MIPLLNSMSWGSSKRCSRANISIFSGQHIALNFHIVCALAMRAGHADFLVSSMSDGYKVAWGRTKDMGICLGLKVGCGLDGMKSGGHRVLIWHAECILWSKSRVWGRTGVWGDI